MRRIWKVLGTIGSFLTGYFLGGLAISFLPMQYFTNERELIIAGGVLIGLIVANWWYKNSPPVE